MSQRVKHPGPMPLGGPLGSSLGGPIWGYGIGGAYGTGAYGGAASPDVELMLQAVVTLGDKTTEGHIIQAVTTPWFAIIEAILRDAQLIHSAGWRKLEEIIAGAYTADGWDEVTLTPGSGDKGRDVIATRHGFGSIRIIDQVKAYAPGHLITFEQVSSMVGVLAMDPRASKAIITTTSDFAPGVYTDEGIKRLTPTRLELRHGGNLREWLAEVAKKRGGK